MNNNAKYYQEGTIYFHHNGDICINEKNGKAIKFYEYYKESNRAYREEESSCFRTYNTGKVVKRRISFKDFFNLLSKIESSGLKQ